MKKAGGRLTSLLLAFVMIAGLLPAGPARAAEVIASGKLATITGTTDTTDYGDFTLTDDGVLTVTGNGGPMPNFGAQANSVTVTSGWNDHKADITSVVIENCTTVGAMAFYNCMNLTSVSLPEGLTRIAASAFSGCSSLTEINIPNGVTEIYGSAFKDCAGLTSVTLPDTLTTIGSSAFSGCSSLTSIVIPDSVERIGADTINSNTNEVVGKTSYAFQNCTSLTSVTLSRNMTELEEGLFSGCTSLERIEIPAKVKTIGANAFSGCTGLKTVTFYGKAPDSVASTSFPRTLTHVSYPLSNSEWNSVTPSAWGCSNAKLWPFGETTVARSDESTVDLTDGSAAVTITSSSIPFDQTEGAKVGNYAVDPDSVAITRAVVGADQNSVTLTLAKTGTQTAAARAGEVEVTVAVKPAAFAGDPRQGEGNEPVESFPITIPVIGLAPAAEPTSGDIMPGDSSYGTWSLDGNGKLTIIGNNGDMPNFSYASPVSPPGWWSHQAEIRSVVIESCTSVGDNAFNGYSEMISVVIPSSVTTIGESAFYGCTGLETVTFQGAMPSIDPSAFNSTSGKLTQIRYPYGERASWASGSPMSWGANSAKMVPYGTTELDMAETTVDLSGGSAAVTVRSDTLPFDPTEGSKVANYESSSERVAIAGAALSADQMSVTLTLTATAGTSGTQPTATINLRVSPKTLAAERVDSKGATIGNSQTFALTVTGLPTAAAPNPDPTPEPTPTPTPTRPSSSGGSGGGSSSGGSSARTPEPTTSPDPDVTELPFPEVVPPPAREESSPLQGILKENDEPYVDWVERVDLPAYARDLYGALLSGAGSGAGQSGLQQFLVDDSNFRLLKRAVVGIGYGYEVIEAETLTFSPLEPYAGSDDRPENVGLPSMIFADDTFFTVDVSKADQGVNYGALRLGDVVKTDTFNGVFVTKIPRDDDYDDKKKETSAYIGTVFQAFDMDHPEVFWLSGKCKIKIITAREGSGGQMAYFFLTLVDDKDFTMRSPDWTANGAVAAGIARRDGAVDQILANLTGNTVVEQIRELNHILTERNEYNTTPDLTTIGNEPHECLAALEGRTGTDGPVCDGYSRAFKVLCDRLGIPCTLETGYAKPTTQSAGTYHMWNSVQVGGSWYGVDVTWNDPRVSGIAGARSGRENEQYLLVGSATEIRGMTFALSHPVLDRTAEGGVLFNNGPILSAVAFSALSLQETPALPYTDVAENAWYHDAVAYAYENGLMNGVSSTQFQPDGPITRQQIWMVLARLSGERPADMAAALEWAVSHGVSDGTDPQGLATRQQLVTLLYRFGGHSGSEESLAAFRDREEVAQYARAPFGWAVEQGIVTGISADVLSPTGSATRAQFAAILQRYTRAAPEE